MSIGNISKILTRLVDRYTKYIAVIQSDHSYIHKGLAYTSLIDTGAITASYKIGFKTPDNGKCIHWRPLGGSSSAAYASFKLYQGNAYTSGTEVVPINRNQEDNEYSVTDMQDIKQGVTATITGKLLQHSGIGTAGTPVAQSGGGAAADQEIILKTNTEYVIDIVPSASTTCLLTLFWYEEDCI